MLDKKYFDSSPSSQKKCPFCTKFWGKNKINLYIGRLLNVFLDYEKNQEKMQ